MSYFINGIGAVLPFVDQENNWSTASVIHASVKRAIEPEYKNFISGAHIRRMSRIIKMGYSAAALALKNAEIEKPDAILTSSGLGCIEDTDKFVTAIIKDQEKMLTPTAFIQSTHNTVGGQIALLLSCNAYNMTYVHRHLSFETALQDALLLLDENKATQLLCGGLDELTNTSIQLMQKSGLYHHASSVESEYESHIGAAAGEGASFFVLSKNKSEKSVAELLHCSSKYSAQPEDVSQAATSVLNQFGLTLEDTLLLSPRNGDKYSDQYISKNFEDKSIGHIAYKNYTGEYHTATSAAMRMACDLFQKESLHSEIRFNGSNKEFKHALIVGNYRGKNQSFILLKKC